MSVKPLKLADQFPYLDSNISSTERDINIHIAKVLNAIDRLLIIWKSDQSNKIKWNFFQAVIMFILLYGWMHYMDANKTEKKLDGNYTRILRDVLNKSCKQHSIKQHQYGHLPPISQTIQLRRTKHARHCWRRKDEFISDIL